MGVLPSLPRFWPGKLRLVCLGKAPLKGLTDSLILTDSLGSADAKRNVLLAGGVLGAVIAVGVSVSALPIHVIIVMIRWTGLAPCTLPPLAR